VAYDKKERLQMLEYLLCFTASQLIWKWIGRVMNTGMLRNVVEKNYHYFYE